MLVILQRNSHHAVCRTRRDVLHQDGALGGQSQAVGAEAGVPLDLDGDAERVVPLIGQAGLCCFPIRHPVSAEQQWIMSHTLNVAQGLSFHK